MRKRSAAPHTGSRALSLQRGSLLDTVLRLGGTGLADMWQDTLDRLQGMKPPIGEVPQLKQIRADIRERMARFVSLAPGDAATAFFASELTRENLREVVRLFIAAEPVGHSVPFARLGTGSINLLVFALLTVIAELKEKQSSSSRWRSQKLRCRLTHRGGSVVSCSARWGRRSSPRIRLM